MENSNASFSENVLFVEAAAGALTATDVAMQPTPTEVNWVFFLQVDQF